jgi:putative transposase
MNRTHNPLIAMNRNERSVYSVFSDRIEAYSVIELTEIHVDKLILRTDNGPQFTAHAFQDGCVELPVNHTRIPNNTPNMNAHIESFHSILESDCLSRHEFQSYAEAYKCVSEFMDYYNNRRRHGSLKNKAPMVFYRSNIDRELRPAMMVA